MLELITMLLVAATLWSSMTGWGPGVLLFGIPAFAIACHQAWRHPEKWRAT